MAASRRPSRISYSSLEHIELGDGFEGSSTNNSGHQSFHINIHQSVKDKDIGRIREAVTYDRNILLKENDNGEIALHIACQYTNEDGEDADIVQELLDCDDILKQKQLEKKESVHGNTPLHVAAYYGKVKTVIKLCQVLQAIDKSLLILKENNVGWTALHIACQYNEDIHVEMVQELLDCDEALKRQQLETKELVYGNTPLHLAAYRGNEKIVKKLLEIWSEHIRNTTSGTDDVNIEPLKVQNSLKNTPIHSAAYRGHVRVFKVMYEYDKECIRFEGCYDSLPLHIVCGYGHLEAVKQLLEWDDSILEAASVLKIKQVKSMIQPLDGNRIMVEKFEWDSEGQVKHKESTALTRACQFNRLEIVDYLLEKGAQRHSLALIKAIDGSYKECVKKLLFKITGKTTKDEKIQIMKILKTPCESDDSSAILTTPFCELVKHMPDVAESVLHESVRVKTSLLIPKAFTFSYELVDYRHDSAEDDEQNKRCCSWKNNGFNKKAHPLFVMVQHKRLNLLTHPVVASLIHDKWKSVYGIVSLLHWISYLGYLAITNSLLLTLPHPSLCTVQVNGSGTGLCDDSNITEDCFGDQLISSSTRQKNIGLALFMLVCSMIGLLLEVFQAVSSIYLACSPSHHQHKKAPLCLEIFRSIREMNYFWRFSNWVKVTLFLLSTIIAVMVIKEHLCLPGWAWQIGAVVMWLSWIELIYISTQFQFIGVYALMFNRILRTLLKLIPLALILVTAFGLTFHLLIYQPHLKGSPYYTGGFALIKTLAMTTGDDVNTDAFFGFDFHGQTQNTTHLEYLGLSTFFWIISLVLITIILSNLLIGLAVGDIQSVYEKASFEKLALQVDYILTIENQIRSFPGLCNVGNKDKKEFTPNEPSEWHQQFLDEFIYITWGGTRYDSRESKQRLIDYRNNRAAEHAKDASTQTK